MPLRFYMDHHVPRSVTMGLRLRGVDVVTAFEDEASLLADPELLDRAHSLQRVLFTQDDDFLIEAHKRQVEGIAFSGVAYAHQQRVSIGGCVRDLEMIAHACSLADVASRVIYLPL